jgi:hypothetical protein
MSDEQKDRRKQRKTAAKKAKGKRKIELQTEDTRILDERAAKIVAEAFYGRVCLLLHKKPRVVVVDNGSEFANALLKELLQLMSVRVVFTAPENPRANYVERIHSVLGQRLKILTNDSLFPSKRSWDKYVPYIEHALNNRNIVDRICPADCVLGRNDCLLVDELEKKIAEREALVEPMPVERRALVKHAREMLKRQESSSKLFGHEILLRQEQLMNRFQRKKYHEYYEGDFVLLKRKNIGSTANRTSSKLNLSWSGPHEVIQRVYGSDVYKIRMYNSARTLRAPSNLLAPLSKEIIERPLQKTLWQSDTPRCAADLFPVQGDKLILIGLPKYLMKSNAKVKGKGEFYVVEFQRKIREKDDCEEWEVVLMGSKVKRKSATAVSSFVNPLISAHQPAWSTTDAENIKRKRNALDIVYSNADQTEKGYHLVKFTITDEMVLPIVPFTLNGNGTIPKKKADRIAQFLENREQRE